MADAEHPDRRRGPGDGPTPTPQTDTARRLKIVGIGALVLVGLVFVVQNSGTTQIALLWWSVQMPLVFVLVAMIALGVGLDRLWVWRHRRT